MIKPSLFYNLLNQHGTDFFAGVPDSLLKNFCAYVTDNTSVDRHIISANEGSATALAAGYHFATGKIPLIYMQNSGEGNMINPLLSLADSDVYSVPMLILIGWRGEPGVHDEPQHVKQGKVTCSLLDAMNIPYEVLTPDENQLSAQLDRLYSIITENSAPAALVIKKGTFDEYTLQNNAEVQAEMKREEAIEEIILNAPEKAVFVSTTGMASRELFELREKHGMSHESDFLTVGSMGHASQIALSIALQKKDRPVFCIDGDGAAIMQMGGMATIGTRKPGNLVHIVLNNGAHDSVGGQPTVGLQIDLPSIARSCGYPDVYTTDSSEGLKAVLANTAVAFSVSNNMLTFIEVKVSKGARKDLGRPTTTPIENKNALMRFLEN